VLHPLGQGVADEADVIAWSNLKHRRSLAIIDSRPSFPSWSLGTSVRLRKNKSQAGKDDYRRQRDGAITKWNSKRESIHGGSPCNQHTKKGRGKPRRSGKKAMRQMNG
jgi:hypothetical protein